MKTIKTNLDKLFIWFGDKPGVEKITFGGITPGIHYTMMLKLDKRVINIHRTIELGKQNKKEYEQLFEMKFFTAIRLLLTLQKNSIPLFQQFWLSNRINMGKLGHHNLVLMSSRSDKNEPLKLLRLDRPKKVRFAKEIGTDDILHMLLNPIQILQSTENSFWVYSTKKGRLKREGMLFRLENSQSMRSFYFASNKSFRKFMNLFQMEIFKILDCLEFFNKEALMAGTQLK